MFLFGGVEGRECVSSRESATERGERSRSDEGWAMEGEEGEKEIKGEEGEGEEEEGVEGVEGEEEGVEVEEKERGKMKESRCNCTCELYNCV